MLIKGIIKIKVCIYASSHRQYKSSPPYCAHSFYFSLATVYTKRQYQRSDNSAITLQNEAATHFQASPLFQ